MPSNYKILYLFENPSILIIKIKLLDLRVVQDNLNNDHWLYFDKQSASLVKLWFLSSDSSTEIEERYFEQGFLKFSKIEATFIEKFNSSQHKLINYTKRTVTSDTYKLIDEYLKQPGYTSTIQP